MKVQKGFAAVVVLSTATLFTGCQKATTTEAPSPAAAAAPATAPVPKFTFVNAALAKSVPPTGEINAETSFSTKDNIQAVAILEGKDGTADVKVEVLGSDGAKVMENTSSGPVVGKAAIATELAAPQAGWVPGSYTAKYYLDGIPSWEVKFNITQ